MQEERSERRAKLKEEEIKLFEELYTWLEKSMPESFFQEVKEEWIQLIVHSLMFFKLQHFHSEIEFKNGAIALTLETPKADLEILENFPERVIQNYVTYVSKLDLPYKEAKLKVALIHFFDNPFKKEKDLSTLSGSFPEELIERAKSSDLGEYRFESPHLYLAWRNAPVFHFLYRLAKMMYRHGVGLARVHASYIEPYSSHGIFLLSVELKESLGPDKLSDFLRELLSLKFFGSMDLFERELVETNQISGNKANLLRAMRYCIHQLLVHLDPNFYSLNNIEQALVRHPDLTLKLLSCFELKFHPSKHKQEKYDVERRELYQLIEHLDTGDAYLDQRSKNVLHTALRFVDSTLKTNCYLQNKSALSFRLEPTVLGHRFKEAPFALFFIKGMHFFSFHIRFKDLARGGLRTVFPHSLERAEREKDQILLECYNLALTQDKKNKDIPEGGAKGVIFLKPNVRLQDEEEIWKREMKEEHFSDKEIEEGLAKWREEKRVEYLHETQRSFVSSLMTLINCYPDGTLKEKEVVDYWKKPEYIYLGPDENMHDEMIEWIAEYSKKEGYKPKGAFITGKREVGINHKHYGVTSLGVHTCVEEVLAHLKIDPRKEAFTVKMTGGPDGDVAGNEIKNLWRFNRHQAKLVALTDVSGTIYDPHGLNLDEMMRLFNEGKAIHAYTPEKLHDGGYLLVREKKKEITPLISHTLLWRKEGGVLSMDWISGSEMNTLYRNNVHQAKADIFIPCGGRPRTLHEKNIEDFLDAEGRPTSKAIVEGANLYLSEEARLLLEDKGVLIIKDSSANKGGVITSSFEVLSTLTLSEEEFLRVKEKLVEEILERVQLSAYREVKLLLDAHVKTKKRLTQLSEEISQRIELFKEQIHAHIDDKAIDQELLEIFLSYAPPTLRGYREALIEQIPDNHKKAIIATTLASDVVYTKGLDWLPSLADTFFKRQTT